LIIESWTALYMSHLTQMQVVFESSNKLKLTLTEPQNGKFHKRICYIDLAFVDHLQSCCGKHSKNQLAVYSIVQQPPSTWSSRNTAGPKKQLTTFSVPFVHAVAAFEGLKPLAGVCHY
jgi:hypothetical protein